MLCADFELNGCYTVPGDGYDEQFPTYFEQENWRSRCQNDRF